MLKLLTPSWKIIHLLPILLAALLPTQPLLAEHAEGDAAAAAAGSKPRPIDGNLMKEDHAKLLGDLFHQPWKEMYWDFAWEKPGQCAGGKTCLNDALQDIKDKKGDDKMAIILADLFNSSNDAQVKEITEKAEKLIKEESDKEPLDEDKLAILERVQKGGKRIQGESIAETEEDKKFNDKFAEEFVKFRDDKNKSRMDYVAKATDPDLTPEKRKEAKDWLRKNIGQKGLASWLSGQIESGQKWLASDDAEKKKQGQAILDRANQVADAFSWDDGNGNKFLDLNRVDASGNQTPFRLYLGRNNEDIGKALDEFNKWDKNGLLRTHLAATQHQQSPQAEWWVNAKGQFVKGRPNGVSLPAPGQGGTQVARDERNNSTASQARTEKPTDSSSRVASTTRTPRETNEASASSGANRSVAVLTQQCNACHSAEGLDPIGMMDKEDVIRTIKGGSMPKPGGSMKALTPSEKQALIAQFGG